MTGVKDTPFTLLLGQDISDVFQARLSGSITLKASRLLSLVYLSHCILVSLPQCSGHKTHVSAFMASASLHQSYIIIWTTNPNEFSQVLKSWKLTTWDEDITNVCLTVSVFTNFSFCASTWVVASPSVVPTWSSIHWSTLLLECSQQLYTVCKTFC